MLEKIANPLLTNGNLKAALIEEAKEESKSAGESTNELPALSLNENALKLLSFPEAFWEGMGLSYAFIGQRFFVVMKSLFNAFFAGEFSNPDAAVGLAMGTLFQQLALGVVKGGTGSIDSLFAKLESKNEQRKIGPLIQQARVINTLIGLPITALFYSSDTWLKELGMESSTAGETARFLKALSFGFWFICMSLIDQGFLLSIQRKWSPMILSTVFVLTTMAISYPMALSTQNIAWFGYGTSIAGFLTFLAGRMYLYLNKTDGILDREKYNIFTKSFDSGYSFFDLLKLYLPSAGSGFNEWGPNLITAFCVAKASEKASEAQVPSVQLVVAFTQILQALCVETSILTSGYLGRAEDYEKKGDSAHQADNMIRNAKLTAYAMSAVTTVYTLPVAVLGVAYPRGLVELFCHNEASYGLADNMVRITSVTILLDGIRNVFMGALLGNLSCA